MSLPILPKATFPYKNQWLKAGVKLHPFTVGQESILIQVKDSKDRSEKLNAIKQIIVECVEGVVPGTLPLFLVEDLFLRIREKSAGETITLTYVCSNEREPLIPGNPLEVCNTPIPITINLQDVKLVQEGEHTTTFQVTDDVGVKMRYPTLDSTLGDDDPKNLILLCIESVFDAETVYPADQTTSEDLTRFYNSMPMAVKNEIREKFFATMPSLKYTIQTVCPNCGYEHVQEVESLNSIFI